MAVTTTRTLTRPEAASRLARDAKTGPPLASVRVALVGAMTTALAVVASGAFDRVVWQLVVAPPIVTAVSMVSRRWSATIRIALAVVATLAATGLTGVLAGAELGELATGVVAGPQRLLTTEWPSPRDPKIVIAVAFLIAIVAAIAAELAGRRRFHIAPLAVVAGGLALAMAVGAPLRPARWIMLALAVLACAVVLARPGDDTRSRSRTLLGERSIPVTAIAVVVAAVVVALLISWVDRADPRRTREAERNATLLDPIESSVALRGAEPAIDMFRVTDRSTLIGPSLPARWRVAALDEYDGQRWLPTVTLRPIGQRLGVESPASPDVPPLIRYDLEILTDDIDVLPFPGRPLEVDTRSDSIVETDSARTVVRLDRTPAIGATIRASSEMAPTSAAANATIATRQVDETALTFTERARNLAGDGTVLERVRQIEATMRDEWLLDSRAPGAGQQLALINRFIVETQRGTEEQFVTAFVLLVRSIGVDARVATGFVVPPEELGAPLLLRSSHAAVWPEIRFIGAGWVPFDPTPVSETTDVEQPPPPPGEQSPAAAQPPIAPPADREDGEDTPIVTSDIGIGRWANVRTLVTRVGTISGLVMLPVAITIATILTLKWRRRRRRLRHADPARRVLGAWANATDSLIDAGLTIDPAWTDIRIAEEAKVVVATMPHDMRRLAASAAAMTFGDRQRGPRLVDEAVRTASTVDHAIRTGRTRWERVRWRLSLRSLRHRTRSPIAV